MGQQNLFPPTDALNHRCQAVEINGVHGIIVECSSIRFLHRTITEKVIDGDQHRYIAVFAQCLHQPGRGGGLTGAGRSGHSQNPAMIPVYDFLHGIGK